MNDMVDVPTVECDKSRNNYTRCKCDLAGNIRNMLIAELKFICKQSRASVWIASSETHLAIYASAASTTIPKVDWLHRCCSDETQWQYAQFKGTGFDSVGPSSLKLAMVEGCPVFWACQPGHGTSCGEGTHLDG
jgi:hypothetical protein